MRVLRMDRQRFIDQAQPVEGGGGAESTSAGRLEEQAGAEEGRREVFVLARKGEATLDTPVFDAGEQEAVAVFGSREEALRYAQTARWEGTHEPVALAPAALGAWVREAGREGIGLVAVDPDRQAQMRGERQSALLLEGLADPSDGNVYREVQALRRR